MPRVAPAYKRLVEKRGTDPPRPAHSQYDVKRVEEIVYDVSLRGLLKDRSPEWDQRGLGVIVDEERRAQVWAALCGTGKDER